MSFSSHSLSLSLSLCRYLRLQSCRITTIIINNNTYYYLITIWTVIAIINNQSYLYTVIVFIITIQRWYLMLHKCSCSPSPPLPLSLLLPIFPQLVKADGRPHWVWFCQSFFPVNKGVFSKSPKCLLIVGTVGFLYKKNVNFMLCL